MSAHVSVDTGRKTFFNIVFDALTPGATALAQRRGSRQVGHERRPARQRIRASTGRSSTVCIMLATVMQVLDTTIANVALPNMQGSLGATRDQITWVLTSYNRCRRHHDAGHRLDRRPLTAGARSSSPRSQASRPLRCSAASPPISA